VGLSLLKNLEKNLHEAEEFSDVWDYFMTVFGEVPISSSWAGKCALLGSAS
jgi:hypothetical protein